MTTEPKPKSKQERRLAVIKELMGYPDGRWWFNRLILTADPNGSPVSPDNPYVTYYKNGEQTVTRTLLSNVQKGAPDEYLLMLKEAKNKPEDVPYDANDPDAVEKAEKDGEMEENKRLNIVKLIMQAPEGRWWLYDLLEYCCIFSNPVVAGDPYMTYNNNGKQNIGRFILIDIQAVAADEYLEMIKENWRGT